MYTYENCVVEENAAEPFSVKRCAYSSRRGTAISDCLWASPG